MRLDRHISKHDTSFYINGHTGIAISWFPWGKYNQKRLSFSIMIYGHTIIFTTEYNNYNISD